MLVSFGKKPRKSKTSEVYEIGGVSFFLYNTKTSTKGNSEIYYIDNNIYPLIAVAHSNEKAKLWIDSNINLIKMKIATIGSMEIVTREIFDKATSAKDNSSSSKYYYPTLEELQVQHNKIKEECSVEL